MGNMTNLPGVDAEEVKPSDPQYVSESFIEKAKNWSKKKNAGLLERMKTKIIPPDWSIVTEFEKQIAAFFGAPYAVAVDSCTHGLELVLRYKRFTHLVSPKHTYVSIPMLANKLGIPLEWSDDKWSKRYWLSCGVVDAATFWDRGSFTHGFMVISFQHQKHLSLSKGGMILCQHKESAIELKKASYDGRLPEIPWREQDIETMGFHYYMSPETALLGLQKLPAAIEMPPRIWSWEDYPDLTTLSVFKK